MLRYDRQTKPGLVALYETARKRSGPFLQPRSPHGAQRRSLNKKDTGEFWECGHKSYTNLFRKYY